MRPPVTIVPMHVLADIEACHERLHWAGWSIGDVGTSSGRHQLRSPRLRVPTSV
jgi:hypothetical protein